MSNGAGEYELTPTVKVEHQARATVNANLGGLHKTVISLMGVCETCSLSAAEKSVRKYSYSYTVQQYYFFNKTMGLSNPWLVHCIVVGL